MVTTALSKSDEKALQTCLDQIDQAKLSMVNGAVAIGLALIQVRKIVPKSEFVDWVDANCGYSKTTAYRFIEAAETFGTFPKLENFQDSALYVLAKCEPAAKKAKEMASCGKIITHEIAKELVERAKEKPALPADSIPKVGNGASETKSAQEVAADDLPESEPFTCPNCGGTETDDDGDCAKCHEPAAAVEPELEPEGGYEPHEARKPLDKLFKALGDAARSCKDAQKILPNCVHLADCFAAIDTASLALHRSRSNFKRRPK